MSAIFHIPKTAYAGPKWDRPLTNYHFMNMIGLAFIFHAVIVLLVLLVPRQEIITVPVHALNIKLGGNEGLVSTATTLQPMPQTVMMPADAVPVRQNVMDALDQSFAPPPPPTPAGAAQPAPPLAQPGETGKTDAIRHYVRAGQQQRDSGDQGSQLGNSTAENAQIMARYEQLISQWIQRHKIYPNEARAQKVEGKGIIRLRIDRKGRIKFFSLEKSTGSSILDDAVGKMVKASDPVPAAPENYPAGALLEFLVPVGFSLGE